MALSGRLEDMNLLEILQIIAFSKKTGSLSATSPAGRGAVLFRDGRVQCALSATTIETLRVLSSETFDASRVELFQKSVRLALEELVTWRVGSFEFRLTTESPLVWEGLDVGNFLLADGVDPGALMLDLARRLDESRRKTTDLLETTAEGADASTGEGTGTGTTPGASFPGSDFTVLVVDDEEQVGRFVADAIANTGTTVETASGTADAIALVQSLRASGRPLALVTDVSMPSADGESFLGGLDLVERVRELDVNLPILLMAESLSPTARSRARALGLRRVAFKPALTKLDADEYEADLRAFADTIVRELENVVQQGDDFLAASAAPPLQLDAIYDFLRRMTEQLHHPGIAVARMILRVANKYAERSLLFLVKESRARGLAGVQTGHSDRRVTEEVRKILVPLQDLKVFAEVVYSRMAKRSLHERGNVPADIAPGRAHEFALLPLVLSHEVVAIIYLDNPTSGRTMASLSGLEMFMNQAGMAMDNASLHRKVRLATEPFSIENQGPLTQELSRIVPSAK